MVLAWALGVDFISLKKQKWRSKRRWPEVNGRALPKDWKMAADEDDVQGLRAELDRVQRELDQASSEKIQSVSKMFKKIMHSFLQD